MRCPLRAIFFTAFRSPFIPAVAVALLLCSPVPGRAEAIASKGIVECTNLHLRRHNPDIATTTGRPVCFQAYVSDFNIRSADPGDGKKLQFATPNWVVQKVEKSTGDEETKGRPSKWFTVPELQKAGLAPTHESYAFSQKFLKKHPNWYERGHLAAKYLAERMGGKAGWFTHNVVNAVPQRGQFNRGAWFALECFTGAWANRFDEVWIVSGPIYDDEHTIEWLTSDKYKKALPVAIPAALFKIVARKGETGRWEALAFVYPQKDKRYGERPFKPSEFLASIADIERRTGGKFFPAKDGIVKTEKANELWQAEEGDFDASCKQFAPDRSSAALRN